MRDMDAITFFALVGFLTHQFSKNMIVVLLTAMLATNLLMSNSIREGLAGKKDKKEGEEDEVPCPAVLFGQFFLWQDYFAHLSVSETLVFEIGFFLSLSPLDSCTDEPFGARDPPFLA